MQSSLIPRENAPRISERPEIEEQESSEGSASENKQKSQESFVEELTTSSGESQNLREGTLQSAFFNILSSMVGGGSLSLPLAFYQAGNGFLAPFLLICIAGLVDYSIYFLVQAGKHTLRNEINKESKGSLAYESVASAILGTWAGHLSTLLVCTICFFTVTGYGVLLRDMLLPISDYFSSQNASDPRSDCPTFVQNATMLAVVLLVTPLCTLQNLTALKNIGVASMISVLILFFCVTYRSAECNFSPKYDNIRRMPWREYISFLPAHDESNPPTSITTTLHQLANSLPILITVFMCHFNVLPVHNELCDPSPKRVNRLFTISMWSAAMFYLLMGFVGSMYGNCTESGLVEGNVLLSFADDDTLLLLGRGCLSLTIAFALPVFVVPARDMFLRAIDNVFESHQGVMNNNNGDVDNGDVINLDLSSSRSTDANENLGEINDLSEPLLGLENGGESITERCQQESRKRNDENRRRIIVSITILWSAISIACCVKSIDTVWDILGGSFQIIIGFIIPSASYLSFTRANVSTTENETNNGENCVESVCSVTNVSSVWYRSVAWILLIIFIPLMCICTSNSIYNIVNG